MKLCIIFATLLGFAVASTDLFVGSWKEDQNQRQGLNDYLWARGLNWFKRVYVTGASFELTAVIAKEQGTYTVTGKKGPRYEDYQFNLVADGITRTDIDLGQLGGPRKATAKFQGNDLVTELHKLDNDVVDVIATRSIDPSNPNVMTYTLTDVESGYKLVQKMNRQ